MRQRIIESEYKFDDTAVEFSKLTDEEAAERMQKVKDRIKEIKGLESISQDPKLIWEMRELQTSLSWMRANKNRSKYFKIEGGTFTNRKARRASASVGVNAFSEKGERDRSKKRRNKSRQKRKEVQVSESVFSRIYRKMFGEKEAVSV